MATRRRPWPTAAAEARDRTAEELQLILAEARRLSRIVSEGTMTRAELLYIASRQIDASQTALRYLEQFGAQTRPT